MAMNKKEQAAMQAAIDRAETLAALRWTEPVERDIGIPEKGFSEGWDYNTHSQRVWIGWSDRVAHGSGPAPTDFRIRNGSQGSRKMFSTKAKALAAMRHEVEKNAASELLKIDRLIAAEKAPEVE
jgi:hypothetical protein